MPPNGGGHKSKEEHDSALGGVDQRESDAYAPMDSARSDSSELLSITCFIADEKKKRVELLQKRWESRRRGKHWDLPRVAGGAC